ncbi:MAG: hypothetical protein ABIJ42_10125, partial [Acidobacteriota bacterium]
VSDVNSPLFEQAVKNGEAANESLRRCDRYVQGWLKLADPETGLIPRNTEDQFWNARDSAADNYPFMVLTASFTDRALFEGKMKEMLETETRLTSRIGSLPDTWDFSKRDFQREEPDLFQIIFGSSEYIKDGLLPLTEWLGSSPWSERMMSILDEMWAQAPVETPYGNIVSTNVEVNGEMLQVLSRVYWMTGDSKYLEWAIRLGDYYLLDNKHHPTRDSTNLRLRDHGCEIVSGLCELYATVNFAKPARKREYQEPLHLMLDRILEVGRNEHGLFYDEINPTSGTPVKLRIADTWGYTLNGFYTVYLIDKTESYLTATLKALSNINDHYRNYKWERESSDGYADSIESALNLYNREPVESAARWIDSETRVMWLKQQEDGVIEGWHGDGNFARTSIMYALWKTQGTSIQPWREDVILGAVQKDQELYLYIKAGKDWSGKLVFDESRHKTIMKLPIDWPRINQFPEWFTVSAGDRYSVDLNSGETLHSYTGKQLREGIELTIEAGEEKQFVITMRQ